jgi:hypothetical protein
MQVYLPDVFYREVKEQGLRASELLQGAVVAELQRRERERALDEYVSELLDDVGQPSPEMQKHADAVVRRIQDRAFVPAG